ncbi:MAG: DNA polymerase Y family protein, partial [Thermoplasmata archaeon]|nr:DNA polymerase Y family protein [Thermoplasmata archaeon]
PLPVDLLGRPDLADLLRNLGIVTLGGFAALGEADVLARFGWDGARAHRIARGQEELGALTVSGRAVDGSIATELEPPATLVDEVVFAARRLAETLCERIRNAGLAFSLLAVTVESEGGDVSTRRWSHDGPFTSALVIERVRWQPEGWLAPQREDESSQILGGVVLLRLEAEEIVPDGGRQAGLWERGGAGEHHVIQAFARVQGMLGPEGVLQGSLVGGRDPAEQVVLRPFGDRPPATVAPVERPWPGRIPPPSPSLVLSDPLRLLLVDAAGQPVRVNGRGELAAEPASVEIGGRLYPVRAWAGPWPIDERWWEATRRRRRARFQLVVGEEVYLVALDRGEFLLEGKYD